MEEVVSGPTARLAETADVGLKRNSMPFVEVIAQSVASIAPSAAIAFIAAAVFSTAGFATMYAFAIATVLMLLAGYIISSFSRLHPTAGSLYIYVSRGLGKPGAFIAGTAIMVASWSINTGALPGATLYFSDFLTRLGLPAHGTLSNIILSIIVAAGACTITVIGIRTSARVSFVLECCSICILLALCSFSLVWAWKSGLSVFDVQQFAPRHINVAGVAEGLVLCILAFVGFASVDALGREAKNPRKVIPQSIFWSVLIVGIIYMYITYAQVIIIGSKLGNATDPLGEMSVKVGLPGWYVDLVLLGITASFFAVVVAPLNLVGRVLYVMGSEGVIPKRFGVAHKRFQTPSFALIAAASLSAAVVVIFELFGADLMNILVWIDTWGTYGYMLGYVLVSLAAIKYIPRHDPGRTWSIWVAGVIVILAMLGTFVGNVYPVPAYPINILPYLFLATLVLMFCWYLYIRAKRPETHARMTTHHTDPLPTVSETIALAGEPEAS